MSLSFRSLPPLRRLAEVSRVRQLQLSLSLLGFSLAYFLAARIGIATSLPPEGIVVLWPPNAIVLVALLSVGRDKWPLFFLATVATEIAADVPDYPLWAATGYGIVNFSEAALAAALLSRFSGGAATLAGVRNFLRFVAIGPVLASGIAALAGAAIYKIGAPELDYLHYWRVFWLGDALGLLMVGTALLVWRGPPVPWVLPRLERVAEVVLLVLGLTAASLWAFLADTEAPRAYLVFPFLAWAALRFGSRGASLAVVAVGAMAIVSAITHEGLFAGLTRVETVISLQGLIAVVALSTFLLAFSAEDSRRTTARLRQSINDHEATEEKLRGAYRELEEMNRELDRMVAARTRELTKMVARNELLLKEVHHRVKNSLQLVSSLIGIQSRSAAGHAPDDRFSEIQGQVHAIAATYEIVQQMESVEVVDFCKVVPPLCRQFEGGRLASVSIETSGEAFVTADAAVALSLALNELITNSIKRIGADGSPVISIDCRREGDDVLLKVSDNGPGFPPDFDLEKAVGFGMRMVGSVITQSKGRFRMIPSEAGATLELTVPAAAGTA